MLYTKQVNCALNDFEADITKNIFKKKKLQTLTRNNFTSLDIYLKYDAN